MLTALIVSQVLLWLVVAALAVAGVAIARQVGVLHERVAPMGALTPRHGPQVGDASPTVAVTTLDGAAMTIGAPLAAGVNRLLLFVSPQCPICKKLIPIAKRFARSEKLDVVFVGDGPVDEQRRMIADFDIADFPFVNGPDVGMAFHVDKLPHAVLLSDDGHILSRGLVNSREHLESLVIAKEMGVGSVQDYLKAKAAKVA